MRRFLGMLALALGLNSNVAAAGFVGAPTGWKLESYGANSVVLWLTPSLCANGVLWLQPGATTTEHNRLYATVMSAKLANAQLFFYYEQKDGGCYITSFGFV